MIDQHEAFQSELAEARKSGNFTPLMEAIPYARLLGARMHLDKDGAPLFLLPFAERNIGNTMLPALHGGVIGGFMEQCAIIHVMWSRESMDMPKTIDFCIDYLRSGRPEDLHARCHVTRQGARVAHVRIDAWQSDCRKPVAVARSHLLLS